MNILVIDVGGTHVKVLATGQKEHREIVSGPAFTPKKMVSDYARPAIRLSALMELPTLFVFTRDAMGDGEDGPTHQPVEHLASLRAIPGLVTLRPGEANEVAAAYRCIVQ